MNHRGTEAQRDTLSDVVIGAAIEVHRILGPGLLEGIYEEALCHELQQRNVDFLRQTELPIRYKSIVLPGHYKIDLLIEKSMVVELKAVEKLLPIHEAQLLTYMKLSESGTGLLINFNQPTLAAGLKRMKL